MAEFQIVARAYDRMCDSYATCEDCPINENGNDIDICRCRVLKLPCKYESKIMSWALEHPEPVYPTWVEWLVAQDIITEYGRIECGGSGTCGIFTNKGESPIPAGIAQKLGIEPKDG